MRASFSFPVIVRTLAFFEMTKTTVGGLLYSEDPDSVLDLGPGKFEPLGLVEFHFQTGGVKTFVFRDEPVLKAMFDEKLAGLAGRARAAAVTSGERTTRRRYEP
jgi:hypothetical protein